MPVSFLWSLCLQQIELDVNMCITAWPRDRYHIRFWQNLVVSQTPKYRDADFSIYIKAK